MELAHLDDVHIYILFWLNYLNELITDKVQNIFDLFTEQKAKENRLSTN